MAITSGCNSFLCVILFINYFYLVMCLAVGTLVMQMEDVSSCSIDYMVVTTSYVIFLRLFGKIYLKGLKFCVCITKHVFNLTLKIVFPENFGKARHN